MATIALVGNKGGAGKTTLAVNLASALAKTGSTLICDSDPQGSSLQWRLICENEQAPQVIDTAWDLRQQLEQVGQRHEHVLIDCPPSVNAMQTHEASVCCGCCVDSGAAFTTGSMGDCAHGSLH